VGWVPGLGRIWSDLVGLDWIRLDLDKRARVGVSVEVGFPGVFYPSTRQRCVLSGAYKNFTRQDTRQKASGYPSGKLCRRCARRVGHLWTHRCEKQLLFSCHPPLKQREQVVGRRNFCPTCYQPIEQAGNSCRHKHGSHFQRYRRMAQLLFPN